MSSSSGATSNSSSRSSSSSGAGTSSSSGGFVLHNSSYSNDCGLIDNQGTCQGNTLLYCNFSLNKLVSVDCGHDTQVNPSNAVCGEVSLFWGYDCLEAQGGDPCFGYDAQKHPLTVGCQGTLPGCQVTLFLPDGGYSSQCVSNQGTCAFDADGGVVAACQNDGVVLGCFGETQPAFYPCVGGTCAGGRCLGTAGSPCVAGANSSFGCAVGLTCISADAGAGTCG